MDTRVSKLANIVDDKTIIAQLIREKSDRIGLIEFKEARADIWQFFRLVCLDGVTLPYAVCVRCMKPVSYKAREGTGGLHRHPCSKQAIAAAIAAGIPFNTSTNRSAKANSSSANKSSVSASSSSSSQLVAVPNKMNTNFKSNFPFNSFAAIEMVNNLAKNSRNLAQDLMGSLSHHNFDSQQLHNNLMTDFNEDNNIFNEEMLTINILKLFCSELIPLEVLENGAFMKLVEQLISFGANNGPISFERIQVNTLLCNAYETSRIDFKHQLNKQSFITFVVDLWLQEITQKQFMTLWAHFSDIQHNTQSCKIIATKDMTLFDTSDQLLKQLDSIRQDLNGSNLNFVYLFDNSFINFDIKKSENILFCVNHQLNNILDELLKISEFSQMFIEIKTVLNLIENFDGLSCLPQVISNINNWSQILKIFQILKESTNLREIIAEKELKFIGNSSFIEISTFLVPFAEALNCFCNENDKSITTINLVTLWRVKLENHCKVSENDSNLLKSIKEKLRDAITRSNLDHSIYLMAVCFDPRFKKLKMLTKELRDKTYEIIRKQINHSSQIKQETQRSSSDTTLITESVSSDVDSDQSEGQIKRLKTSDDKTTEAFNEYLDVVNEQEKDELDRYLNLDVGQTQPMEFWYGEHASRLPSLRLLATRILNIPAVPVKCCQYSTNGELLSIRRKALDSRYLDKVLLLHSHFHSV